MSVTATKKGAGMNKSLEALHKALEGSVSRVLGQKDETDYVMLARADAEGILKLIQDAEKQAKKAFDILYNKHNWYIAGLDEWLKEVRDE